MNPPTTGYYSLIQYCPDRMRLEAANIGVLLFCPERQFLQARLASSNRRIDRFFGGEAGDLKQINAMKKILEHRLEAESQKIRDVEGLQRFAELLANEFVITEPRAWLVEEPEVELAQLYEKLVGRFIRKEPGPERLLLEKLRLQLETPRIQAVLKRDVVVKVPVVGNELKVPYAYQNGRLNLIEAHEFNQQREQDIIRDVLTKAAQGNLIYKHPDPEAGERQLVVVAAFSRAAAEHRQQVETVLRDHNVTFVPDTGLADLERQIAETAH
jgi:hypothetical protein